MYPPLTSMVTNKILKKYTRFQGITAGYWRNSLGNIHHAVFVQGVQEQYGILKVFYLIIVCTVYVHEGYPMCQRSTKRMPNKHFTFDFQIIYVFTISSTSSQQLVTKRNPQGSLHDLLCHFWKEIIVLQIHLSNCNSLTISGMEIVIAQTCVGLLTLVCFRLDSLSL